MALFLLQFQRRKRRLSEYKEAASEEHHLGVFADDLLIPFPEKTKTK